MNQVVLGLGSNKSYKNLSPLQILSKACCELEKIISSLSVSSVYKTGAMYVTSQEDFYNMVVTGFYNESCEKLLEQIHSVEALYGRNREEEYRNGPRSLDIDIELFGKLSVKSNDLVIPHERMLERAFVLKPLLDISSKNADVESNKEFYENKLKLLADQKIDLFMDSFEFEKMRHKDGYSNN